MNSIKLKPIHLLLVFFILLTGCDLLEDEQKAQAPSSPTPTPTPSPQNKQPPRPEDESNSEEEEQALNLKNRPAVFDLSLGEAHCTVTFLEEQQALTSASCLLKHWEQASRELVQLSIKTSPTDTYIWDVEKPAISCHLKKDLNAVIEGHDLCFLKFESFSLSQIPELLKIKIAAKNHFQDLYQENGSFDSYIGPRPVWQVYQPSYSWKKEDIQPLGMLGPSRDPQTGEPSTQGVPLYMMLRVESEQILATGQPVLVHHKQVSEEKDQSEFVIYGILTEDTQIDSSKLAIALPPLVSFLGEEKEERWQ